MKTGVVQSPSNRATAIRGEQRVFSDEADILRHVLQLTACPFGFIDSVINISMRSVRLKKEVQPLGIISIPCIRGIYEKFKRIAYR